MRWILRLLALTALAGVVAFGLVACGGGDDEGGAATTSPTETTAPTGPSVTSPAADLRVTLDRLLGEHAMLAVFAMQKGASGDEDFEQIAAALDENSVALGDAIGSVYGDEARDGFLKLWRDHIGFFVEYTQAAAANDNAGKRAAIQKLDGYRQAFAEFMAGANPNLQAGAVADLLQQHVNQLTAALDTYQTGNYKRAYGQVRAAYEHMFGTGDALAGAIATQFPDKFPAGDATTSAADLRVALDRLLGEHAMLAVFAMQKGAQGGKDFNAIAAALDENTVALGDAIGSVYGDEARDGFLKLWRDHIGFFVEYTQAAAAGDQAGKDAAIQKLDGYRQAFAEFLAGANPNLEAGPVADLLQQHVNQLTAALDTYLAGDFAEAYTQIRQAYEHMFGTGDALSGAIVAQFPDNFAD